MVTTCIVIAGLVIFYTIFICGLFWVVDWWQNPVRKLKLRRMRKLGRNCFNCKHFKYDGSCKCETGTRYDPVKGIELPEFTFSVNTIGRRKCKWEKTDAMSD